MRSPGTGRGAAIALLFLSAVLGTSGVAQAPALVTERPGLGDGSSVVPKNGVQVETGYAYFGNRSSDTHALGQLLTRFGISSRLELRLALNSFLVQPGQGRDGMENATLGAKVALLTSDATPWGSPGLALILQTGVPTGAGSIGADGWEPLAKLAADWQVTSSLILSGNVAYLSADAGGDRQSVAQITTHLAGPVGRRAGWYFGYGGSYEESAANQHILETGATYLVTQLFQVDISGGIGLGKTETQFFIGVGVAARF